MNSDRPATGDVVRIAARAYERDRYLAALLAPRATRDGLIALAAFAGDVARIPVTIVEPMAALLRLQWWRDAITTIASGHTTGHPITDALGIAIASAGEAADSLIGYVDAIEATLEDAPFADDEALLAHLDAREGNLFAVAAGIAGRAVSAEKATFAAAGRAYGLARMLAEWPALASQGRTLLPRSRLAAAGMAIGDLAPGHYGGGLAGETHALAAVARANLAEVRARTRGADRLLIAALLPCALVEPYLRVVEQTGRRQAAMAPDLVPVTRVWRLWLAHSRCRI